MYIELTARLDSLKRLLEVVAAHYSEKDPIYSDIENALSNLSEVESLLVANCVELSKLR